MAVAALLRHAADFISRPFADGRVMDLSINVSDHISELTIYGSRSLIYGSMTGEEINALNDRLEAGGTATAAEIERYLATFITPITDDDMELVPPGIYQAIADLGIVVTGRWDDDSD